MSYDNSLKLLAYPTKHLVDVCVHTCVYVCVHVHMCAHMYIHICVHCICVYMLCMCVHVCVYVCVHVHMCVFRSAHGGQGQLVGVNFLLPYSSGDQIQLSGLAANISTIKIAH